MRGRDWLTWLLGVMLVALAAGCAAPENVEPMASSREAPQAGEPVVRPSPTAAAIAGPVASPTLVVATPVPPPETPYPTATPVPPFPGMIYETADGLWQVSEGWQPQLLTPRRGAQLAPDGTRVLTIVGEDVVVEDLAQGTSVNVTAGSGRGHVTAAWWAARPDTLLLTSRAPGDEEPNNGYLTLVNSDGSGYVVVDDAGAPTYAHPAASPDGQTVAFDAAGSAMLYDVSGEVSPFDFAAYGLPPEVTVARAASPAWAADGTRLAWVMAVTGGGYGGSDGWEIVVGIFDLARQETTLLHPFAPIGRGGWFAPPVWSPDGQWLAFYVEAQEATERGLWVLASDGSDEQYLGPQMAMDAVWSPAGNGAPEGYLLVKVAPADGPVEHRLLVVPTWTPVNAAVALPEDAIVHGWWAPSR